MSAIGNSNLKNIIEVSDRNIKKAYQIIDELQIEKIWKTHSGKANLIGSVKTNLLMDHLDIDFHVYTKEFSIKDSFDAIGEISQSTKIKKVNYINMTDSDDQCIEWHLEYLDDENNIWQIDIIHIMNNSKYAGKFERVADKIFKKLTDEKREKILKIKYEASMRKEKIIGIKVYRAVIDDNIDNYEDFLLWEKENQSSIIDEWEPE